MGQITFDYFHQMHSNGLRKFIIEFEIKSVDSIRPTSCNCENKTHAKQMRSFKTHISIALSLSLAVSLVRNTNSMINEYSIEVEKHSRPLTLEHIVTVTHFRIIWPWLRHLDVFSLCVLVLCVWKRRKTVDSNTWETEREEEKTLYVSMSVYWFVNFIIMTSFVYFVDDDDDSRDNITIVFVH